MLQIRRVLWLGDSYARVCLVHLSESLIRPSAVFVSFPSSTLAPRDGLCLSLYCSLSHSVSVPGASDHSRSLVGSTIDPAREDLATLSRSVVTRTMLA